MEGRHAPLIRRSFVITEIVFSNDCRKGEDHLPMVWKMIVWWGKRGHEHVIVHSLNMLVQVKTSQASLKIEFAQLYWVIHSETAWGQGH